jgi:macrodomain Ter protein organizer (MatP/YcbG family)
VINELNEFSEWKRERDFNAEAQRRREKIIDFEFWVLDLREFNAETQGD